MDQQARVMGEHAVAWSAVDPTAHFPSVAGTAAAAWMTPCKRMFPGTLLLVVYYRLAQPGGEDAKFFSIFGDGSTCQGDAPRPEYLGYLLITERTRLLAPELLQHFFDRDV